MCSGTFALSWQHTQYFIQLLTETNFPRVLYICYSCGLCECMSWHSLLYTVYAFQCFAWMCARRMGNSSSISFSPHLLCRPPKHTFFAFVDFLFSFFFGWLSCINIYCMGIVNGCICLVFNSTYRIGDNAISLNKETYSRHISIMTNDLCLACFSTHTYNQFTFTSAHKR